MAIRIRNVKGCTIALCAAESQAKAGDLYLDDNVHHALTTKFGLDFSSEGFMKDSLADPILVKLMKRELKKDIRPKVDPSEFLPGKKIKYRGQTLTLVDGEAQWGTLGLSHGFIDFMDNKGNRKGGCGIHYAMRKFFKEYSF